MLLYPSQYFFHLSPVIIYWLSATVLIIDWAVITQGSYGILWSCLYPFLWLVHWREPKLCKCSTVGCFSFGRGFVCREANQHHLLPLPVSRPQPLHKTVSIHAEVFTANIYFLSGSYHKWYQWRYHFSVENDNIKTKPVTNSCSLF